MKASTIRNTALVIAVWGGANAVALYYLREPPTVHEQDAQIVLAGALDAAGDSRNVLVHVSGPG